MPGVRRLRAVRAIVRPDRRDEYLERWRKYASAAETWGARVRLLEDQVLPGRFLELTEHEAAQGMELALERAVQEAELQRSCVRREGDEVLYREVTLEAQRSRFRPASPAVHRPASTLLVGADEAHTERRAGGCR